ncbi:hypothetical protein [Neorhodopirellula pilleata]|uniref:Uncharacterized protein n=1 Tax=Neorhodopirellula pilleata TaxID=2714738 RepID=A0A5C6AGE2_9BACT|nr:hypothetical protein [Neorhodopirellula pilleata]TWT97283.1 hypothetical protein Pla100_24330 [Neorhodopirellula pilleata]
MVSDKPNIVQVNLPEERLPDLAEMIATGEAPVPNDWPPDVLSPLLDLVHVARHRRLVHFIACAIASDIDREKRSSKETNYG